MTDLKENGFLANQSEHEIDITPSQDEPMSNDTNDYSKRGGRGDFRMMETPADTAFARTKRQENAVLSIIQQARSLGTHSLDLSAHCLLALPDELLQMEDLEYLYLEGNEISFLPDDFFKRLPKLKWLDLRNNHLNRIPTVYLSSHTSLRNLLLQNNNLKNLPLELGLVKTLHGLNITNNPLEFPPADVISKGTYEIQRFLREMLQAKSSAKYNKEDLVLNSFFEDSSGSSSSDDWNTNASMMELARQRLHMKSNLSADTSSYATGSRSKEKLIGPVPTSAELHRPVTYNKIKQLHMDRLQKSQSSAPVSRKPSSVQSWKVNPYPEPPSHEFISFKMAEERQMAKVREMKEKTEAILQRRKDVSQLKNWREDAKKLQAKKQIEILIKGTKEYPETAAEGPFGIDSEYMKMLSNEDRFKESKEKPRRALSPASRMRIEEEKSAKIRELEKRIKSHTTQMMERRRKPKGTPQEEMEAAKRELEIAENLQRQLMNRHKNVEFRLKEFEADVRKHFPVGTRLKH